MGEPNRCHRGQPCAGTEACVVAGGVHRPRSVSSPPLFGSFKKGMKGRGTHKFKDKVKFAKAKQFGGRAVGGDRPLNNELYRTVPSCDYLPPDTKQEEAYHRSFTPIMRTRRHLFIWVLYAFLAVVVAVVVLAVLAACDTIMKVRAEATEERLHRNELATAWMVWTGSSLVLCLIACVTVLWQPAAASSGIPGLIAYMNGVMPLGGKSIITGKMTDYRASQTLFAKLVGMTMSVPSGLAIGPEGPIIHISAMLGHCTVHLIQSVSRKFLPRRFHYSLRPGEDRDFLATGAACGICVAFNAPLAGCLFIIEEAASFYTTEHLDYTFFATIIAYLVVLSLAHPDDGFTKFKQVTGQFCTVFDGFDMLMFVAIAATGGVSGAFFNFLAKKLDLFRARHIKHSAFRKMAEVAVLTVVTGTVAVCLPAFFGCQRPTRSLLMQDSIGCLSQEDAFQISHGYISHEAMTQLVGNTSVAQRRVAEMLAEHRVREDLQTEPWNDVVWIDNAETEQTVNLHYQHSYNCNTTDYSSMSMLWLNGGVKGVKVLMQRGFPHMISWQVLLTFFVAYFVLTVCTAGASVPAGLIVPMLLLGGSYGRATGLLGIELKKTMCEPLRNLTGDVTDTFYWSTVYRWVGLDCRLPDPGMYAVVGMASFLGGSTRITMMLATVIVELTDDASLIAPVGVASIISMIVGNLFNHGLYHALIPVLSLPFLNSEPADVMWLVSVVDVMSKDVIALSKTTSPHCIREMIRKCDSGEISHHAFPVVDCQMKHKRLRGIITLESLRLAAKENNAVQGANGRTRRFSLTGIPGHINLLDFADRSPITTVPHAKVARAFELFRKLGMRHLCVCDNDGILVGIITRKDLMTFKLADNIRLHKAEAMLRGWANRWRAAQVRRKKQEATAAAAAMAAASHTPYTNSARLLPPIFEKSGPSNNMTSTLPPIVLPGVTRTESTERSLFTQDLAFTDPLKKPVQNETFDAGDY